MVIPPFGLKFSVLKIWCEFFWEYPPIPARPQKRECTPSSTPKHKSRRKSHTKAYKKAEIPPLISPLKIIYFFLWFNAHQTKHKALNNYYFILFFFHLKRLNKYPLTPLNNDKSNDKPQHKAITNSRKALIYKGFSCVMASLLII